MWSFSPQIPQVVARRWLSFSQQAAKPAKRATKNENRRFQPGKNCRSLPVATKAGLRLPRAVKDQESNFFFFAMREKIMKSKEE